MVIDSISQHAGDPYPSYFSTNIGKVWPCSFRWEQRKSSLLQQAPSNEIMRGIAVVAYSKTRHICRECICEEGAILTS